MADEPSDQDFLGTSLSEKERLVQIVCKNFASKYKFMT